MKICISIQMLSAFLSRCFRHFYPDAFGISIQIAFGISIQMLSHFYPDAFGISIRMGFGIPIRVVFGLGLHGVCGDAVGDVLKLLEL